MSHWGLCVGRHGGLPPERGRQSKYQLMTARVTGPEGLRSARLLMAEAVNWNCGPALGVSAGRLHFPCSPLSHRLLTSCQWNYKLRAKMKSGSSLNSSWCEVKLYLHKAPLSFLLALTWSAFSLKVQEKTGCLLWTFVWFLRVFQWEVGCFFSLPLASHTHLCNSSRDRTFPQPLQPRWTSVSKRSVNFFPSFFLFCHKVPASDLFPGLCAAWQDSRCVYRVEESRAAPGKPPRTCCGTSGGTGSLVWSLVSGRYRQAAHTRNWCGFNTRSC